MRAKKNPSNGSAEKTLKAIRRATRRRYAAEKKIRRVLEGLRGEIISLRAEQFHIGDGTGTVAAALTDQAAGESLAWQRCH